MFFMTLCLVSIVVFQLMRNSFAMIVGIGIFLFAFQSSMGPICFLHLQETCHISQLGLLNLSIFFFAIVSSIIATAILESFGAVYMFSMFVIITFLGTIVIACVSRDTTYANGAKNHSDLIEEKLSSSTKSST